MNYTLMCQDNILLITGFLKSNKCWRMHSNFDSFFYSPNKSIMQDQVQWAGGVGVLFSLYGHMHRSEVSPPYMGQGAVMRMKHKASWSTVTLMDAVAARGVAASVHMAESRCKSLDVFIVPVQLTGCWWKCDKYTVCCISRSNMCAHTHTQNNWPEYKCTVRLNGRRLSDIKKLHQLTEHFALTIMLPITYLLSDLLWKSGKDF